MRRLACLLASALVAFPAVALQEREYDTGSLIPVPKRARLPDSTRSTPAADARAIMATFGSCTLSQEGNRVTDVMAMPIGKPYVKALKGLASSECLVGTDIRFDVTLMRGALFSALWRQRLANERRGLPRPPSLPAFDPVAAAASSEGNGRQLATLLWFATCVVERDRNDASEVIVDPADGKAQLAAYQRLSPHFSPCFAQGGSLTLTKPVLEGALAEALYRTADGANAATQMAGKAQ